MRAWIVRLLIVWPLLAGTTALAFVGPFWAVLLSVALSYLLGIVDVASDDHGVVADPAPPSRRSEIFVLTETDLRELLTEDAGCPDSASRADLWLTVIRLYRERDEARGLVRRMNGAARDADDPIRRWHDEQCD